MNKIFEDDDIFSKEHSVYSDKTDSLKKFRNNSYYQAVGQSPKSSRSKFIIPYDDKKKNDTLYQEIFERSIAFESMSDDDASSDIFHCLVNSLVMDGPRISWEDHPKVRGSGILETITPKEKKRQEAMYELVTSETSYLRSLNILHEVFAMSDDIRHCVTHTEYHHLFSNLEAVRNCSRSFLYDLESRIRDDGVISDVCDIVLSHFTSGWFEPYITYCSNEVYQQRALQDLMQNNTTFRKSVKSCEKNKSCGGLPLHSFLLLPLQRITRLPLLIDAIRQKCEIHTPVYRVATKALRETSRLVKVCNERARELQATENMIQVQGQLEFKSRTFPLVAPSRYLIKKGKLVRVGGETGMLGFKKIVRHEIYIFLFNDMLIIARKKGGNNYIVTDYCTRHVLRIEEISDDINGFYLTMEKNQDGRRVLIHLEAESPSSKARWMMSMRLITKRAKKMVDKNCIQVRIIRTVYGDEGDMVTLQKMDVVAVLESTVDGWYYGERIVDGERGWFPSSHAKEILNSGEREKNLKRRTRIFGVETSC